MSMQTPSAGKLMHRLRFERRGSPGTNVGGVIRGDWAAIGGAENRAASVEPTFGGDTEANIAGRMTGKVRYDIWVRSDAVLRSLKASDRAVNVRTNEIYSLGMPVDPDNSRKWLLIQAVSAGNADAQG